MGIISGLGIISGAVQASSESSKVCIKCAAALMALGSVQAALKVFAIGELRHHVGH